MHVNVVGKFLPECMKNIVTQVPGAREDEKCANCHK